MRYRETVVVCFICFFFSALCLHSYKVSHWQSIPESKESRLRETIVVTVRGAVERPGRYHFEKGVKLEEVLHFARLTSAADVSNLDFQQKITKNRKINILQKKRLKRSRGAHTG